MSPANPTQVELQQDLEVLRARVAELERADGEREQAEEALREREQRFRTLVDQAADAFFLITSDGQIRDVNQRASESLGYTAEELLSMNIADVDVEAESHRHKERFWDKVVPGQTMSLEGVQRRKDGTTFPVEVRIGLLERGGERLVLGSARDITERKKADELLESERQRLYSLLDGLPAFVYLQAPDHSVRFANRYFRKQFGDPEGRMCYEVLWGAEEPCKPCPTFRVFDTKEPQMWEWSQSPDGRIYEISD